MREYNVLLYPGASRFDLYYDVRVQFDGAFTPYTAVKLILEAMEQQGLTAVASASVICLDDDTWKNYMVENVVCATLYRSRSYV